MFSVSKLKDSAQSYRNEDTEIKISKHTKLYEIITKKQNLEINNMYSLIHLNTNYM